MKNLSKLNKQIQKENDLFEKMSKAEKRIVIAKDCLLRIQLGQLEVESGYFGIIPNIYTFGECDIKTVINNNVVNDTKMLPCSGCAKGSLFFGYVGRVNNFKVNNFSGRNYENNSEHEKLLEIFSLKQLAMIEFAFEGLQYISGVELGNEDDIRAFFTKHGGVYDEDGDTNDEATKETATTRFIAICENIIKNKGTFKP